MRNAHKAVSKTIIAVAAIIVILVAVGGGYYYTQVQVASKPILIGLVAPLSGTFAPDGQMVVDGAQLAINYINSHGGILGHKAVLIVKDEGATTQTAETAVETLVENYHIKFLIGPFWSGDVAAVLPFTYSHKVIEILTVSSENLLLTPPYNKYVFRTTLPDSGYAYIAVQWLKLIGAKNAVFLAEDYVYAHEVANFTISLAKENGINITWVSFYPGTATDYSTAISEIASLKPDAVIVIMEGINGVDFQKQYSSNPITSKIPILDLESLLDNPQYAQTVDSAVPNGMNYVFLGEMSTITNESAQFSKLLQQTYGIPFNHYAVDAYDGVMVLAMAINRAGTTNTTAVANALMQTYWTGPGGTIKFASDHEPIVGPGYLQGTIYQVIVKNNTIYYEIVWPSTVANFTAINPATGQPY